jgi:hypothetical protein
LGGRADGAPAGDGLAGRGRDSLNGAPSIIVWSRNVHLWHTSAIATASPPNQSIATDRARFPGCGCRSYVRATPARPSVG